MASFWRDDPPDPIETRVRFMNDLIRFRCARCNASLKIAGAKAGSRVACPKCGLELVIPETPSPELAGQPIAVEPPRVELIPAGAPEAVAVAVPVAPLLAASPSPEPAPAGVGFLNLDLRLDDSPTTNRQSRKAEPKPAPATPQPAPAPQPQPAASAPVAAVATPIIAASSGEVAVAPLRSERGSLRTRDVVIPRAAVVGYTTFAILGLFFAFLAGLLIGHFLWTAPPSG